MTRPATRTLAVIPARDEAARLPAALSALATQGVAVIVVANGCADATAAVGRALGATVIETPALAGGVGAARRLGMARALGQAPDWVLTTDADCVLAPGCVDALARALGRADAAFGRVVPDPVEFAALPRTTRIHGALEDRHAALVALIAGHSAAQDWNPPPCHGQSPGALIALRPDAYRAAGGFAPVRRNEDRMMAAALAAAGLRVARPWHAVVQASCRLTGRAPGGMADTIAARVRADLAAETARLAQGCAHLERRLSRIAPGALALLPHDLSNEGETDVPAPVQAAI